jgi:hypothetical protein
MQLAFCADENDVTATRGMPQFSSHEFLGGLLWSQSA